MRAIVKYYEPNLSCKRRDPHFGSEVRGSLLES